MSIRSEYYRRERNKIIQMLGGKCIKCSSIENLEIHHDEPTLTGHGRGRLERLRDWKKNNHLLTLYCEDCHKEYHSNEMKEYHPK